MTRGNINFIYQNQGEMPRTLYYYQNGDMYPTGIEQAWNVHELLEMKTLWKPEDFKGWIARNFKVPVRRRADLANGMSVEMYAESEEAAQVDDLGEGGQPRIYYTEGFITDYSYVFEIGHEDGRKQKDGGVAWHDVNTVKVWCWDKLIFSGSAKKCMAWINKQIEKENKRFSGTDKLVFAKVGKALGI